MLAIWNDPAFIRFVGDRRIHTVSDAERALRDGALRLYAEHGYGPYHASLRGDGTPVGICGLFRRDGLDDTDIGFSMLPEFCGRGLAFEAAQAVVAHAQHDLRIGRLTALVSPLNAASIGLIEKLGFSFESTIRIPGEDSDVSCYAKSLDEKD